MDRTLGQLVLPGLGFSVVGTIWAGAWIHGFYSVLLVFGQDHAQEIFQAAEVQRWTLQGYALVPLNLMFARTRFADMVLPTGTMFLLATQLESDFRIDWTIWPPLPSTVFACLPAARSAYNWCYERAFGELNRKWLAEVQPRHNERVEGQQDNVADAANVEEDGNGGLVFQLEVNIGAEAEVPMNDDNANAGEGEGQADGNGDQENNNNNNQILGPRGDEIIESSSSVAQNMLGALIFPAVAAGMGELLSHAIPSSWMTSANFYNGRSGFLRHKWGRAVLGGCLFVVMKDAVVLYCRWKMAQSHRERKIMDFDKKRKQYELNA